MVLRGLFLPSLLALQLLAAACVHEERPKTEASPREQVILAGGIERTYLLYVPPSYSANSRPAPLLLLFHGGGMTSEEMLVGRFNDLADRYGFIVVYPQGVGRLWRDFGYPQYVDDKPVDGKIVDDVAFVRELVERIRSEYAIDAERIHAAGVSLGGMFSYHLACRMSDTFAAVAVVSGAMITPNCAPKAPVALLHIHPKDDKVVPLDGVKARTIVRQNLWPPVANGIEFWRDRNGCATDRHETFQGGGATCWTYDGCAANKDVSLCLVEGGHQWPGLPDRALWQVLTGTQVAHDFPATERIWAFFQAHPK